MPISVLNDYRRMKQLIGHHFCYFSKIALSVRGINRHTGLGPNAYATKVVVPLKAAGFLRAGNGYGFVKDANGGILGLTAQAEALQPLLPIFFANIDPAGIPNPDKIEDMQAGGDTIEAVVGAAWSLEAIANQNQTTHIPNFGNAYDLGSITELSSLRKR
ncbi:hypothetical protein C8R43DRAFT_957372 [Mycena crocata]|nr:hypothetical protein C8R43DRAFT_957372 [Mycena crocata]